MVRRKNLGATSRQTVPTVPRAHPAISNCNLKLVNPARFQFRATVLKTVNSRSGYSAHHRAGKLFRQLLYPAVRHVQDVFRLQLRVGTLALKDLFQRQTDLFEAFRTAANDSSLVQRGRTGGAIG